MLNSLIGIIASSGVAAGGDYESIATVTVGGSSSVTFSSIPSTYQHLQIRAFLNNSSANISTSMQFNGDTGTNYSKHGLFGDGASATAAGTASTASMTFQLYSGNTSSIFSGTVIDILDYKDTNKYTTVRGLGGYDNNGSGLVYLGSGLWMNTAAVSSITFGTAGGSWATGSSFALYGIRG